MKFSTRRTSIKVESGITTLVKDTSRIAKGALLWLWFPNSPITSFVLYLRFKRYGVIVVSGKSFFLRDENWSHRAERIRVSHAQQQEVFNKGVETIADEVQQVHQDSQLKVIINA